MTDDEIREGSDWTLSKPPTGGAPKLPSTQRTVETGRRLHCSTNWPHRSRPSHPTLLLLLAPFGTTTWIFEQHSEMFRQIGFHSWPETAEDFVKACISDRAMRA